MTIETLVQMAREGDGSFGFHAARKNILTFRHVDGRTWDIRFETPREARGWLSLATR